MISCMVYNTPVLLYGYKLQTLSFIRMWKCNISATATSIKDSLALASSITKRNQTYSVYPAAFTWSVLENECGLSVKTPTGASDLVGLESSCDENGPHSAVKFFREFGFSQTHITRILSKQPGILAYQPQKYLKPKLDFLFSITCSRTDVVSIVTKNPFIFTRSLNNHLVPFFNSLKFAAGSDQNAAAVIKCNPFILSFCNSSSFVKNIEFLQTVGVPRNQILKLITKYGQSVGVKHEKFCTVVLKVKDMGFDISSSYFREAVLCLTFLTEFTWESRCEIYRSFGLSNDDIITMFKKQPVIMSFSEKRIREMLEFFVQKLRWSPSRLSNAPNVFLFSLEKRIIPRCSVLQALVSNKCNIKGFMLQTILKMDEGRFLKSFVTAYKDKVPEVMDAYQGTLIFGEYNFESESEGKFKIIHSNRTISTTVTKDSLALTTPLLEQSSDEKAHESVIKLFKSFGFSKNHIARIVRKQPHILTFHPQKSVKPKLDYLFSIAHSQLEVFDIVAKNPVMLTRSLKNHIIPFFTLLESVTGSDQNLFAAIKRNPYLLSNCVSTTFLQNTEFLQKLGVPQILIMKLITDYGQSIGESHGKFCKVVLKVKDMGFDLSSSYFLDAVRSFSFLSDLAWESRCEMFRSFGFSDHDIISMVKKQPVIMIYSEKRMRDLLEFFVQKLRWSATKLSTTPNILRYSLEKRIIPRCSVLQALVLNNCNSKRLLLTYIVTMTESRFLESFVTAYKNEVPEVMDAYRVTMTESRFLESFVTAYKNEVPEVMDAYRELSRLIFIQPPSTRTNTVALEEGMRAGESDEKLRSEFTGKGFNPTKVARPGYYCAMKCEKCFEACGKGKQEFFEAKQLGTELYGWIGREDDYYSEKAFGDFLREFKDLKTVNDLEAEEKRKSNKLLSNLSNVIEEENMHLKEIKVKYNETSILLNNLIAEKDKLFQSYNEEKQKMQQNTNVQLQNIIKEHQKMKAELEKREKDLKKREPRNDNERRILALEGDMIEKATLEQKKAYDKVFKLTEYHKRKNEELEQTNMDLEKKIRAKQMALKWEEEPYKYETLQTLGDKECKTNDELQDAQRELINLLKKGKFSKWIGVKKVGELDVNPFHDACKRKYTGPEAEEKAVELCSLWEDHLRDPDWFPLKIVGHEGGYGCKEIIDEEDERLKRLKAEWGSEVQKAVASAAFMEMIEYNNPTGMDEDDTWEQWNHKAGRKATLREGISYVHNETLDKCDELVVIFF